MKHNPMATANATAVTVAVIYVVCLVFVLIAPEFSFQVARGWFHGMDLMRIWSPRIAIDSLGVGFISAIVGGWIVGYIFATTYNTFIKK